MSLRGQFLGCIGTNALLADRPEFWIKKHLESETGTMTFPFHKGTGWIGLFEAAEGSSKGKKVRNLTKVIL